MTPQTASHPRRRAAWARGLLCPALAFALLLPGPGQHASAQSAARHADQGERVELAAQVTAAYVYKFAAFVDWPDDAFAQADSALVIAAIGADALADVMITSLAGRQSNGRRLIVKKLRAGDALAGIHILYLGNLSKPELSSIYASLKERPVLTITESADAFALGSMINFVLAGERLRFEIALQALAPSRLRVSALMLAAALRVTKGGS